MRHCDGNRRLSAFGRDAYVTTRLPPCPVCLSLREKQRTEGATQTAGGR
jgi:hypothetical protein